MAHQAQSAHWLEENGPRQLEQLFRAIVYHPAAPLLLIDNDRYSSDASVGAGKLLGVPRDAIIGRSLEDFASSSQLSERWRAFLKDGEQNGILRLVGPDGGPRDVGYSAKSSILPVRHLLVLQDGAGGGKRKPRGKSAGTGKKIALVKAPSWVQDYALSLLDTDGNVVSWYAGSERIYGYKTSEVAGRPVSLFQPDDDAFRKLQAGLKRASGQGHTGTEGWQLKKDGTQFWASIITMALKDERETLQGFARVVRDFSDRHGRDEKLRRSRAALNPVPSESHIACFVSGEYDRVPEANDAFLELVGYTREDLQTGRIYWPDLTPPEYLGLEELAHEEGLRFGACTPYRKELLRKDGTRVTVVVATAVLRISPFQWVTFVQDIQKPGNPKAISAAMDEDSEPVNGPGSASTHGIIGDSPAMKRVMGLVKVVAPTGATVLVLGETGTGKELIARALHAMSPRRTSPFVTLNCAAIPTGLLESELFGYEKGAFTGALSQKIGRFEMAHKGTLFLDEIGDIPLELQPKLLRALQEKSFERLGGTKTIPIDVRLIAATNRDLTQMMGDKLFRSDLYYRLKVFPITTPPLREHREDVAQLVRHFVAKYGMRMQRTIEKIPVDTMRALVSWPWPGNVRELENFIERAVILSPGTTLRAPIDELRSAAPAVTGGATLEEVERDYIRSMLRETGGGVSAAAIRLGLPRTSLNAMMKKLGISRNNL